MITHKRMEMVEFINVCLLHKLMELEEDICGQTIHRIFG